MKLGSEVLRKKKENTKLQPNIIEKFRLSWGDNGGNETHRATTQSKIAGEIPCDHAQAYDPGHSYKKKKLMHRKSWGAL